jgi:hypothetical protein
MKYEYNGSWYTISELSDISGIKGHTIRDRLRRGFTVDEAVKLAPTQNSVTEFCEASWWNDWIGQSTVELYQTFWRWCMSNGFTPMSQQGFTRQVLSMYPQLKLVPTKRDGGAVRIIRERN